MSFFLPEEKMKRLVLLVAVLGFACLFTGTAFGDILNVPTAEYPTIQAGIDAASLGDTVQVAAGTYYENITMKSGVVIQGAGQGISIIDGGGSAHVVYANSVDSAAKLDGFTITNGRSFSGGGMYNYNSSPTITNCTFSGNMTSSSNGGGMYNNNSSPTVTNCTFSGNTATRYGGGMYNYNSSPTITNCTFSGNSAPNYDPDYLGGGGGMNNLNSSPTVTNCTFSGNMAYNIGGGMSNNNSSPIITNSTFSGNTVYLNGGGMSNYYSSSPTVTNCTFSGNTANNIGGGMHNSYSSSPTVTNCILWGDSTNEISNYTSTPSVNYSDIQGGYTGTGNIDADPMFVDEANGDLHLKPLSPCIDAGDNSASALPATDIDGDDRRIDHPTVPDTGNGTPPIVDMGADEYVYVREVKAMPWIPLLLLDD